MIDYIKQHHEKIFIYGLYASYILYALILLGISTTAPKYLSNLRGFLKLYVSIFLLWRFNPYRNERMTKFDKRVVFSCALFLLTTTTITELAYNYLKPVKKQVKNIIDYTEMEISKI